MNESSTRRIAIIGTGLIGGSFGMALRTRRPDLEVIGYDEPDVLDRALRADAISVPASSVEDAVSRADVVVIATPLRAVPAVLRSIGTAARAGTIVTDVGSVKGPIVEIAHEVLPESVTFIGGHPMAGASRGGIDAADPLLFENAVYVLTPPNGDASGIPAPLVELIDVTGARVLVMPPEMHDRVAAAVSHVPQLLSVALVNAAFDHGIEPEVVSTLAAGGFRDMTRIAESPFETWEGILASNHGNVLDALATLAASVQRLRNRLIEEDFDSLSDEFSRASERRGSIPTDMRGFLQPVHKRLVRLEDRPGALKHLTTVLADAEINIKDLELVKIRDGMAGSFRVGFSSADDADHATAALRRAGFEVRSA